MAGVAVNFESTDVNRVRAVGIRLSPPDQNGLRRDTESAELGDEPCTRLEHHDVNDKSLAEGAVRNVCVDD